MGELAADYSAMQAEQKLEHAGVGERVVALIIDQVVLGLAFTVLFMVAALGPPALSWLVWLVAAQAGWMYRSFQHGKWGQTIGKRATGSLVVHATTGEAIGYGHALARDAVFVVNGTWTLMIVTASMLTGELVAWPSGLAGHMVAAALPVWLLASLILLILHRRNRTLHDFIAGTIVVQQSAYPASSTGALSDAETPRRTMSPGF